MKKFLVFLAVTALSLAALSAYFPYFIHVKHPGANGAWVFCVLSSSITHSCGGGVPRLLNNLNIATLP